MAPFRTPPFVRGLDLLVSGLGLVLLAPLCVLLAITIRLTSAGPVILRVSRIGKDGHPYVMYRFRGVYQNGSRDGRANGDAKRRGKTPLGRLMRRTRLDLLPELVNVLRGEMSLVGPPPQRPCQDMRPEPEQNLTFAVPPGLIGPSWQYHRRGPAPHGADDKGADPEDGLSRQVVMDLAYLQHRSVGTDLMLLLQAAFVAVFGEERLRSVLEIRNRHFFLLDVLALLLIPSTALSLRVDGLKWFPEAALGLALFTAQGILVKLPIFLGLGLYRRYWRLASIPDLTQVLIAVGLSTSVLTALSANTQSLLAPFGLALFRTVPLIDGLLTLVAVAGFRFGLRGLHHWHRRHRGWLAGRQVLVVGAGETGILSAQEMMANSELGLEPVAFVDDDPAKVGTRVQGLPVLGPTREIPRLVERHHIKRIFVAIPSAPLKRKQEILSLCEKTGVPTSNLPGVYEILAGHKTISRLPQIDIHRILRRDPVQIDPATLSPLLRGARVLITGAGGSIGSELARQIARLGAAEIVLLGHGENSIFEINLDLRLSFPNLITGQEIADVRDPMAIHWVMARHRPDMVFHAAAHKHVPYMEASASEAITNNVLGTLNVLRAAQRHGVRRLVLISSDKAVNPANVMGATKRVGEMLTIAAAQDTGHAYMVVRFGNVLGSRGSVVPVFQQQIAAGGPVTVTHPEMYRYFMTVPEAVQLVLQAAAQGKGGEAFVLDMGEPVSIQRLALDLIRLSGMQPGRDIQIVHTGIRPGEKLREELFLKSEDYCQTEHEKIYAARGEAVLDARALDEAVGRLVDLARRLQTQAAIEQMCAIVPEYQPFASTPDSSAPPKSPSPARYFAQASPSTG